MGLTLPPSFDDLRALVRGGLVRDDRRALARWLVLHADEYVAQGLDALSVEWEHLQQDQQLPPEARALSEAFWPAFEAGLADVDPEFDRDVPVIDLMRVPETGDPFGGVETEVFAARVIDTATRRVRVTCPRSWSVVASDDLGELHELLPYGDHECAVERGRVTFWAFLTPIGPIKSETFVDSIRAAAEVLAVRAIRITDTFFEPL